MTKDQAQRRPLAERLKTSLEEAVRHARGEITLRTTVVERADQPPEIDCPTPRPTEEQETTR